jgi:hypothetical protein
MKESEHLKKRNTDGRIIFNSGVNWIHPAQDKNQWQSFINMAMNFRLSSNMRKKFTDYRRNYCLLWDSYRYYYFVRIASKHVPNILYTIF